jgi:predicted nucleotidyltransferase
LDTPQSDVDTCGIYMEDIDSIISPFATDKKPVGDGDFKAHELRAFFKMCVQGNATVLEVLWSDKALTSSDEWIMIQKNRDKFLDSKRITAGHMGYLDASIKALTKKTESDKRLRKHYVAGIRVAHQCMQLLTRKTFEVRIENYDACLAKELLEIKESRWKVDDTYCTVAIEELERLKGLMKMTESDIEPFEADKEALTEILVDLYIPS